MAQQLHLAYGKLLFKMRIIWKIVGNNSHDQWENNAKSAVAYLLTARQLRFGFKNTLDFAKSTPPKWFKTVGLPQKFSKLSASRNRGQAAAKHLRNTEPARHDIAVTMTAKRKSWGQKQQMDYYKYNDRSETYQAVACWEVFTLKKFWSKVGLIDDSREGSFKIVWTT